VLKITPRPSQSLDLLVKMGCNGSTAAQSKIELAPALNTSLTLDSGSLDLLLDYCLMSSVPDSEPQEDFEKIMQAQHASGWVMAEDLEKKVEPYQAPTTAKLHPYKNATGLTRLQRLERLYGPQGDQNLAYSWTRLETGPHRTEESSVVASVDALVEAPVDPIVEAANVAKPLLKRRLTMKSGSLWRGVVRFAPSPMLGGC